ncbi:hypothetical protein I5Q34_05490 [Streptomyces sp. AV19]|uniref:DUF6415 family natural product biosynthesis protein n=1 Tax=Streptomyces sp. AV19 TaxID=2793068 RepID=UPI0018FE087B|nr:DUF6415 family natural product biosynthesis protein [Streptomyces sp. AV19]MBH1933753.1 hypothetical protein [Streptomyces sp. AV19]MDG4535742.1 DUF6415 family natural product biosynthesis protein [Streptomyces sp. AV19]
MPVFPCTGNTGGGITPAPARSAPPFPAIDTVIREATAAHRQFPTLDRVHVLTDRLRVYIEAAAAELENSAGVRPDVLAATREARHRLGLGPGYSGGYGSAITFARSLGRAAEELLHFQRTLTKENS